MILKSTPFYREHGEVIPPPKQPPPPINHDDVQLVPFVGSKALRQTHESLLKEFVQMLEELIPEQYKMKIEGGNNPIETEFLKDTKLNILCERTDTNILFRFDFCKTALDKYERKRLSGKLMNYFNNESTLPIVIHSTDAAYSEHIVCIDDPKKFKKLQKLWAATQKKKKGTGTIQKQIPFTRNAYKWIK